MTSYDLTGKKALVTGGAQGLGEATARALAAAGAAVVIADISEEGSAIAQTLGDHHGFVTLDVSDDDAWFSAIPAVVDQLGGLDIVINNAGVEVTSLVTELDSANVQKMLNINVLGTALGLKHGLRAMRPGGTAGQGGTIINISSVSATIAFPGTSVYAATKSAVDRLTRVAAVESGKLGYGVRVNCIYPGLVPTQMGMQLASEAARIGIFASTDAAISDVIGLTPSGRLATAEDIADSVVFLASDAARFINGAGLPVDGGMGT